MALMNKPDEQIFASKAKEREVESFPDHQRGWGVAFEQTEGIPPMEWFNALFKRIDENIMYMLQRGLPEWSATVDYPKGAYVQYGGLSYKSLKATKGKQPDESNSTHWVQWGLLASDLVKASLVQYGITQLFTGYDSDREDVALTPKTAKQLKAFIDSIVRSLDNYIPNSKKSSSVSSNSADTVANSAAVKKTYDLAAAAVPKNSNTTQVIQAGNYRFALQHDGQFFIYDAANNNAIVWATNRVVPKDNPVSQLISAGNYLFSLHHDGYIFIQDKTKGNKIIWGTNQTLLKTDLSSEVNSPSTAKVATSAAVKAANDNANERLLTSIFNNFRNKFTMGIYAGTSSTSRVFRIPLTNSTGLKIYTAQVTIGANQVGHRFRISESMSGFRIGFASDTGGGKYSYGVAFENDESVLIHCDAVAHNQVVNLLLIGEYQY